MFYDLHWNRNSYSSEFKSHMEDFILRKGLDTVESLSVEASGFTKTRAFPTKSGLVL